MELGAEPGHERGSSPARFECPAFGHGAPRGKDLPVRRLQSVEAYFQTEPEQTALAPEMGVRGRGELMDEGGIRLDDRNEARLAAPLLAAVGHTDATEHILVLAEGARERATRGSRHRTAETAESSRPAPRRLPRSGTRAVPRPHRDEDPRTRPGLPSIPRHSLCPGMMALLACDPISERWGFCALSAHRSARRWASRPRKRFNRGCSSRRRLSESDPWTCARPCRTGIRSSPLSRRNAG